MRCVPTSLPSGFDGVEAMREPNFKCATSFRALGRAIGVSPSHICRVMRGERVSHRLAAELAKRGVKVRRAK